MTRKLSLTYFLFVIIFFLSFFTDSVSAQISKPFNRLLTLYSRGEDVRQLQVALNKDPVTRIASKGVGSPGHETDYFGPATRAAVIRLQNKYFSKILKPAGFSKATGVVGPSTISFLNTFLGLTDQNLTTPIISTPLSNQGCSAGALFNTLTGQPCTPLVPPQNPAQGGQNTFAGGGGGGSSGGNTSDTTPPVISSVVAGTITSTSVTITWTTDEVADSQIDYGLTSSYTASTTLNTSRVTSHSVTISNLTVNTTYHYRIRSSDTTGNLSVSSDGTFTTVDTTAPTITITVPAASATVAGAAVSITAAASDNVGVAGVQFKVDGSNMGSEDTSSPYSVAWDSTGVSDGGHSLTAVARDAVSNQTTSATVSITVDNTGPILSLVSTEASTTAATTTWTTSENSDSKVVYGLTTSYGSTTQLSTQTTSHSLVLSNLIFDTTYHYRVVSADAVGNISTSSDATFRTTIPPALVVFLTSGTSWTVPSNWNSASNTIEVIGGGGAGTSSSPVLFTGGSGGGGGQYAKISNLSLTGGNSVAYVVGAGGTAGNPTPTAGGDTYFNGANCGASSVCGKGGSPGTNSTGGAGGTGGVGTILRVGGAGGAVGGGGGGAGGGGAGGPNGVGAVGGASLGSNLGGGGGGGNGGGTAGTAGGATDGGAGGNNSAGIGSGAGGTSGSAIGVAGTVGGGGGGSYGNNFGTGNNGGAGGNGTEWDSTHGSGGGGGGQGYGSVGTTGGTGGTYGGGGGGGGYGSHAGGAGGQGIIVISYTAIPLPDTTSPVISSIATSTPTQTGVTITWTTDESASSQVNYGTALPYTASTTLDASLTTSHSVTVTGLTADTTYHYRVRSVDAAGNLSVSGDAIFTTAAPFDDGLAGAPSATIQYPHILDGYAARPAWNVAGVDYAVGYPSATVLTDWQNFSHAGCVVNSNSIRCDDTNNLDFNGIDFSLHNGASLGLINCNNATIRNSKFGGSNYDAVTSAIIGIRGTSQNVTITNNIIDGHGSINALQSTLISGPEGGGNLVLKYNWFKNFSQHIIELWSATTVVDYRFNFIDQFILSNPFGDPSHMNYLQWSAGIASSPVISYNTSYQTITGGAEGYQFYMNSGGTMASPTVTYNTMLAVPDSGSNTMSYMIHGHGAGTSDTVLTGTAVLHDNYFDSRGAFGAFYPGSFVGWTLSNNVNMSTGGSYSNNP